MSRLDTAKRKALAGIAEIDAAEMTVRLMEIGCKMRRPKGKSGRDALAEFKAGVEAGEVPAYIVQDFEDMAVAAVEYLRECIDNMRAPS